MTKARCIDLISKDIMVGHERDYVEVFEKKSAYAISPYDLSNPLDRDEEIKLKRYRKVVFHETGHSDSVVYINDENFKHAVPLIQDIIEQETRKNVMIVTEQRHEIRQLQRQLTTVNGKNREYLKEVKRLRKPWYKKIFGGKE